jgi:hypothetical protein
MGINVRWIGTHRLSLSSMNLEHPSPLLQLPPGVFHALPGYMLSLGKVILQTHSTIRCPLGLMGVAGN